jgi:hypothetical protein
MNNLDIWITIIHYRDFVGVFKRQFPSFKEEVAALVNLATYPIKKRMELDGDPTPFLSRSQTHFMAN